MHLDIPEGDWDLPNFTRYTDVWRVKIRNGTVMTIYGAATEAPDAYWSKSTTFGSPDFREFMERCLADLRPPVDKTERIAALKTALEAVSQCTDTESIKKIVAEVRA